MLLKGILNLSKDEFASNDAHISMPRNFHEFNHHIQFAVVFNIDQTEFAMFSVVCLMPSDVGPYSHGDRSSFRTRRGALRVVERCRDDT